MTKLITYRDRAVIVIFGDRVGPANRYLRYWCSRLEIGVKGTYNHLADPHNHFEGPFIINKPLQLAVWAHS